MNYVNTVTGPVAASELGRTLMHEHFLFGFCGFQGVCHISVVLKKKNTQETV